MIRGGLGEAAANDHAVPRAGLIVTESTKDLITVAASLQHLRRDRKRKRINDWICADEQANAGHGTQRQSRRRSRRRSRRLGPLARLAVAPRVEMGVGMQQAAGHGPWNKRADRAANLKERTADRPPH